MRLERTKDYWKNARRASLKEPCVRCGRPVDPDKALWIEVSVGGEILLPGDPRCGGDTSQGGFPIGPECRKVLGLEVK
jgi:hypothetical protein